MKVLSMRYPQSPEIVLNPEDPCANAREFLRRNSALSVSIYRSGTFTSCWPCDLEWSRDHVVALLWEFLDSARKPRADGSFIRFSPRKKHVDELFDVIVAMRSLSGKWEYAA